MLILLLSPVLLRAFLLGGTLIWLFACSLVLTGRRALVRVGIYFFVGCPNALAASQACYVTDTWFTPHFSVLARFRIGVWMADVACPIVCQPILACLLVKHS